MSSTCVLSSLALSPYPTKGPMGSKGLFKKKPLAIISEEFSEGTLDSTLDILQLQNHPALRGGTQNQFHENSAGSMNEIMRGSLTLLSSSHGPQRVILSVTRTSVDHFALMYPENRQRKISSSVKPIGCLNLRGINCEETVLGNGIAGFTLRSKKCDTSSSALIFICPEESSVTQWMTALSPPKVGVRNIPRKCSLPMLEEDEE